MPRIHVESFIGSKQLILNKIFVEAGGVEPPSEKARTEENYVRIRLMVFDRHL